MNLQEQSWCPPQYDISKPPAVDISLNINSDTTLKDNFPRTAKWCADGSVILAQCENRTFQLFNIEGEKQTTAVRELSQPAPIVDFLWYPTATPHDPATFCFVASVRECPVKLLDASDGRLRASYRIVDHRERQIAPNSLAFNLTAQKLYCGFEDAIEVFDISRPGEGTRIPTTPSKKSKDGLKGIISSLAFSPSYSPDECFYAAGSFNPTSSNIAMFSDATPDPVMFLDGGPGAGVTQLQFNPMRPHILYAAYRGSACDSIYSWDVRSNVDEPLEVFCRSSSTDSDSRTNQKMRFDVDITGRYLSVGDQIGDISLFELGSGDSNMSINQTPEENEDFVPKKSTAKLQFKAHDDTIGSVAFHPLKPVLLSTSGSRHFIEQEDLETDSSSSENEEVTIPANKNRPVRRSKRPHPVTLDSTIKIWDLK